MQIRHATLADAPTIAVIYNQGIEECTLRFLGINDSFYHSKV